VRCPAPITMRPCLTARYRAWHRFDITTPGHHRLDRFRPSASKDRCPAACGTPAMFIMTEDGRRQPPDLLAPMKPRVAVEPMTAPWPALDAGTSHSGYVDAARRAQLHNLPPPSCAASAAPRQGSTDAG